MKFTCSNHAVFSSLALIPLFPSFCIILSNLMRGGPTVLEPEARPPKKVIYVLDFGQVLKESQLK